MEESLVCARCGHDRFYIGKASREVTCASCYAVTGKLERAPEPALVYLCTHGFERDMCLVCQVHASGR